MNMNVAYAPRVCPTSCAPKVLILCISRDMMDCSRTLSALPLGWMYGPKRASAITAS